MINITVSLAALLCVALFSFSLSQISQISDIPSESSIWRRSRKRSDVGKYEEYVMQWSEHKQNGGKQTKEGDAMRGMEKSPKAKNAPKGTVINNQNKPKNTGNRIDRNKPSNSKPKGNKNKGNQRKSKTREGNNPKGDNPGNLKLKGTKGKVNKPKSNNPESNNPKGSKPKGTNPGDFKPKGTKGKENELKLKVNKPNSKKTNRSKPNASGPKENKSKNSKPNMPMSEETENTHDPNNKPNTPTVSNAPSAPSGPSGPSAPPTPAAPGVSATPNQLTKFSSPSPSLPASNDKCDCRESVDPRNGECFEFASTSFSVVHHNKEHLRPCVRRKCYPKFECVANGEIYTHQCIRKYAVEEVKRVGRKYLKLFWCEKRNLQPYRAVLVPYES